MSIRLLVLHGPNVPLRLEKEASLTLTALHRELKARAKELGATLRTAVVHGEEGLLSALYEQRGWADGVLLASGHLAYAPALSEALALLGVPHVELSLTTRGVAHALDVEAYLDGLSDLMEEVGAKAEAGPGKVPARAAKAGAAAGTKAAPSRLGARPTSTRARGTSTKTLGRKGALEAEAEDAGASAAKPRSVAGRAVTKTLGRKRDEAQPPARIPNKTLGRKPRTASSGSGNPQAAPAVSLRGMPTRAAARAQLTARLSGALDAASLQAWAREGWAKLETAASPDARLSAVLLRLAAGKDQSDDRLISLMTELDR